MAAAFSLGGPLLAAQDVLEAVLQEADAAALRQLKAASVAWCAHVRRELCNRLWVRLSRREGQPEPAGVDSITDLDVKCLNEAGRPWEVVVAGRQLPQLARLHGWGFLVDVQAVREADLGAEEEENDDDSEEEEEDADSPLGGDALRSCIQGEGDPPDELLLAAVACAASGTVRGVPVQRLREDEAIDELNLYAGIGDTGATLLALMLPAATSVRSLEYATHPNPNPSPNTNPLSAPIDTPTLSPFLTRCPCSQSSFQLHRSPGRLCARRRPQGDADPRTGVRRPERSLLCQCPLTSLLSYYIHSAPRSQSWEQPPHRRGQAGAPTRRRGQQCPHPILARSRSAVTVP